MLEQFLFDPACDIAIFFSSERSCQVLYITAWIFPPPLFLTDVIGGATTPPPQQRAGVGLGPEGRILHFCAKMKKLCRYILPFLWRHCTLLWNKNWWVSWNSPKTQMQQNITDNAMIIPARRLSQILWILYFRPQMAKTLYGKWLEHP